MDSNAIKNTGIGVGVLLLSYAGYSWFQKKKNENIYGTDENQEANLKEIPVDTKNLVKDQFYYKKHRRPVIRCAFQPYPTIGYFYL